MAKTLEQVVAQLIRSAEMLEELRFHQLAGELRLKAAKLSEEE